jgi:hypothetical protein
MSAVADYQGIVLVLRGKQQVQQMHKWSYHISNIQPQKSNQQCTLFWL